MKAYWGVEVYHLALFDLGTEGGEWSASRPGRFTPRERAPFYPLDRRLGGPQSRSGRGGEEKNSQPPPAIEPEYTDRPAHIPVSIPSELSRLLFVI
jgi:hypothetical protein